jgi:hypothetical protein
MGLLMSIFNVFSRPVTPPDDTLLKSAAATARLEALTTRDMVLKFLRDPATDAHTIVDNVRKVAMNGHYERPDAWRAKTRS